MQLKELGARVFAINHLRRSRIQKRTVGHEMHPTQLPILEAIISMPGCRQRDAARALGVTAASIALSTKRLEKSGCIEKRVDPDNRRSNQLYATERGRETTALFRRAFDETDAETFAGFSDEEKIRLSGYFDRMIANLSDPEQPIVPYKKEEIHA